LDAIASSLNKLPIERAEEQNQSQGTKYIRTMTLDNEAVATSGDYGQAFVTKGGILSGTFNYKQARLIAPRVTGMTRLYCICFVRLWFVFGDRFVVLSFIVCCVL
jgi:hypothetical protein